MTEHSQRLEWRTCPRDTSHHQARVTTEVLNGKTVITKECSTCGQFVSQTVLPVERRTRQ